MVLEVHSLKKWNSKVEGPLLVMYQRLCPYGIETRRSNDLPPFVAFGLVTFLTQTKLSIRNQFIR
jgi:hypothetical protein